MISEERIKELAERIAYEKLGYLTLYQRTCGVLRTVAAESRIKGIDEIVGACVIKEELDNLNLLRVVTVRAFNIMLREEAERLKEQG